MLKPLDSHKSVTVATVLTSDRPDILRVLKQFTFDSKRIQLIVAEEWSQHGELILQGQ
jgi:hypothetical protein